MVLTPLRLAKRRHSGPRMFAQTNNIKNQSAWLGLREDANKLYSYQCFDYDKKLCTAY
jgi:hypothetical protein